MMEYKGKKYKKNSTDFQYNDKENGLYDFPNELTNIKWWKTNNEKSKNNKSDERDTEILKGNPDINKVLPPGGKEVKDIPDQMGCFETKTAETVIVGFDRYNKNSDLGFTVVSEKDKNREGIPERNAEHPNTYFGGNFDGKEKPFEAGLVSFRYDVKKKEIDKIVKDKKDSVLDDEENLLYQDEKEKEILEKLKIEKSKNPDEMLRLSREEKKIKKITNKKREENEDFLKEIEDFIINLKNGKIKKLIESDEVSKRRRRILELSSKSSEEFLLLIEIKKMLKEIFKEEEIDDNILSELLVMVRSMKLDKRNIEEIVKNLKEKDYFK